jgi:putative copper resistance protein D
MLTALLIMTRAVHIAASILIAGTFTFQIVTLGSTGSSLGDDLRGIERDLSRLAVWSLIAVLLSAVLWFSLEIVNMSGLPVASAFSSTAWRTVLFETEFGRVWRLRLGLVALALALIAPRLARDEARRARMFILWLLSIVLLVSLAWISHAAAAGVQPLGLFGDVLHLCAAGGWIGGFVPLAIFLTHARESGSLGGKAALVLKRFSTLSLCCVSVLIVSGVSNSWLLVGSIHALFTTPYGRLLLVKLALFGILVGLGARNRLTIKTKLLRAQTSSNLLPQLRRSVICEICLGAVVIAIVACLGVTPPAGHP